jgi:hypothetical protein
MKSGFEFLQTDLFSITPNKYSQSILYKKIYSFCLRCSIVLIITYIFEVIFNIIFFQVVKHV